MVRGLALGLTVLTGFSGLVYEVAWQKYLATLLGSHSEATAAILALFLGGLSLGYALFGRVAREVTARAATGAPTPSLLFVYGVVEAAIGVWALVFPLLFAGVRALSLAIPHGAGGGGFALDVVLSALLLLPPTVLMGGTIPILTQALARGLADATRFHAFVYAFNTAGAFFGALAAGFVLVPHLGLRATLVAMGFVNLSAGAVFVWLGRRGAGGAKVGGAPAAPPPLPAHGSSSTTHVYMLVAFLGGFAMMAVQATLNRVGGLAFGASHFTFSMVVASFVLCIALGSFAVSAFARIPAFAAFVAQAALVLVLLLLYPALQDAPYWAHEVRRRFGQEEAAFYPYWFTTFGWMLLVLGVPIGLSGAVLPLLFHVLRREVQDLGAVAGRLYSWNTLGSVCGALLGGYALLFWLDLDHVYRIAIGALAIGAALLGMRLLPRRAKLAGLLVVVVAIPVLALLPRWDPLRLSSGPFRARSVRGPAGKGADAFFAPYAAAVRVLFHDDDPTTSVAVWEGKQHGPTPSRAIVNNGKSDGEIPADYCTMAMAAVLPALLADRVETGFVIGYGTGVTAGELARLESVRRVDVAEIASGVLRAAPLFEYGNQRAATNPKTRLARVDAYRALVRSPGGYDVIASEPSNPWVTGVEMLFSREFLETARDRLSPGGVYAQWFHLYETDAETVALVLRTYRAVFERVAIWYALGQDLILLGFKDDRADLQLDRILERAVQPDYAASLAAAGIRGVPELLAHEIVPLGVLEVAALPGRVHTLFHPRLSHLAAHAFFRGGRAQLPPALYADAPRAAAGEGSLLRQWKATFAGGFPDSLREDVLVETLEHRPELGATLLAQWEIEDPGSRRLARLVRRFWQDKKQHGDLGPLDYAHLQYLLEGGEPPPCPQARTLPELARQHAHPAAPFSAEALAKAAARCAGAAPP